jgi:hypothetical protein
LRYGASKDDPLPFILTLTQQFVAHEIGTPLPLSGADMDAYIFQKSFELRLRALAMKSFGVNTGELS